MRGATGQPPTATFAASHLNEAWEIAEYEPAAVLLEWIRAERAAGAAEPAKHTTRKRKV